MLPKLRALRTMIDASGNAISLEVDGGIAEATIGAAYAAGADVMVAGNAVFHSKLGSYTLAIEALRTAAVKGQ
jgi:ribulose-phosphate 3-epimerase